MHCLDMRGNSILGDDWRNVIRTKLFDRSLNRLASHVAT